MNLTPIPIGDLKRVRRLDDLIDVLGTHLDWPVDTEDVEELTFDWDPIEMGIDRSNVPSLVSVRQLRPLVTGQQWGIFFLEFSGPRLPVGQIRRLLERLRSRQSARAGGSQNTWALDDLLFFVSTGASASLEIHMLKFAGRSGGDAEFRALAWRPQESPEQVVRRIGSELLPHLAWPEDTSDASAWHAAWAKAFVLRHGAQISSAARLAERMAHAAQVLRAEITTALGVESGAGPFTDLLEEIRSQLIGDATPATFADMCAQTLVYGLLASRVTDPESFGASPVIASIPLSTPFLSALFERVNEQTATLDLSSAGIEQLVADLRQTNVEAILDQFGSGAHGGDPVIHFYEEFLKTYDSRMRAQAGAFYTPLPVVEFMVRAVDEVLKDRFGLTDGVADVSAWRDVAETLGIDVPDDVSPDDRFVSMIDPATGTGTFLVEWIRRAKASYMENHGTRGWGDRLRELVGSLHAFEMMLAPYTIAHLKLGIELAQSDVDEERVGIHLTNTLDHRSHGSLHIDDDPIAAEGERADDLKNYGHFTVTVGNPPYEREQRSDDDGSERKGGIARFGVPGIPPLMNAVLDPLKQAGLGKHAKNAYNVYVYFWTWAIWQTLKRRSSPGVVAFITASSYLDGVSLGGLRAHMRETFDELIIIDLGGDGRGALVDENVFDILTPVSIAIGIRTSNVPSKDCAVRYVKVLGTRSEKLRELHSGSLATMSFNEVNGTGLDPFTPVTGEDYSSWPSLTQLMPLYLNGVKAGRTWVIAASEAELGDRLKRLMATPLPEKRRLFKDSPTGRRVDDKYRSKVMGAHSAEAVSEMRERPPITRYGYRSFDRQQIVMDARFIDRQGSAWSIYGPAQVFLTTLTSTKLGSGPAVTATPYVPDLHHFSGRGARNVIPLYRDAEGNTPNVTSGLLHVLAERIRRAVTAVDLVAYIYGLTGTSAFSERFSAELAERAGAPRIPMTTDPRLFDEVAALGAQLLSLHSWGERSFGTAPTASSAELTVVAEPTSYPEQFGYDAETKVLTFGDGRIGGVPPEVWGFEVSGLRPLQSWLGYRMKKRKGRSSSELDNIRPSTWVFTEELLDVIRMLDATVQATPRARDLLDRVVESDLIPASELPHPTDAEVKPPKQA